MVAAVAAQSTLANVFAGIQLAFSDAIRIDDVVVVDGQWGRIDEITLSYVVVHLWDDRRLVLPSGYFTKEPFENWTRRNSELLGVVELDLDWRVDVDGAAHAPRRRRPRNRAVGRAYAVPPGDRRDRRGGPGPGPGQRGGRGRPVRPPLPRPRTARHLGPEHADAAALPRQRVELVGGAGRTHRTGWGRLPRIGRVTTAADPRRAVPRTDQVLADPRLRAAVERLGRDLVKQAVVAAQQRARAGELAPADVADAAVATLPAAGGEHPTR